jgi:hypothetical protein
VDAEKPEKSRHNLNIKKYDKKKDKMEAVSTGNGRAFNGAAIYE